MNQMKKLLSLTLAMALTAGVLTGCGKEEAPDASGSAPAASGSQSGAEKPQTSIEPMDLTGVTDPYLAAAGIPGDTVVAKVGGHDVLAEDLLYWINYGVENYLAQLAPYGITEIPWDTESQGETMEESFLKGGLKTAAVHTLLPEIAREEGLELTREDRDFVKNDLAEAEKRAGSREELERLMWYQMSTVDQSVRDFEARRYYSYLTDLYFGKDSGSYPTDAEMQAFAVDKLGMYRAKHILIATQDPATREPYSDEVKAEKKALAEELLAEIRSAADPAAKFDELMKAHSDDPGLAQAPEGYDTQKGQMVKPFEEAALALKDGEISDLVESDFGYHIVMRLPLKDLELVRQQYVAIEMDRLSSDWLEEYGIQTTAEFDKVSPREFREKVVSLQMAIRSELDAKAQAEAPQESEKQD